MFPYSMCRAYNPLVILCNVRIFHLLPVMWQVEQCMCSDFPLECQVVTQFAVEQVFQTWQVNTQTHPIGGRCLMAGRRLKGIQTWKQKFTVLQLTNSHWWCTLTAASFTGCIWFIFIIQYRTQESIHRPWGDDTTFRWLAKAVLGLPPIFTCMVQQL